MCRSCNYIKEVFAAAAKEPNMHYGPTMAMLIKMMKYRRILLLAGDCPPDEAEARLSEEKHYTVRHYFRCQECGQVFIIGGCIRGAAKYELIDDPKDIPLETGFWGREGSLFGEGV